MPGKRRRHNVPAARDLRQRETEPERMLWELLRDRRAGGLKVRRQHPVGAWVLDFCVPAVRLAIELDGSVHADADQAAADAHRDAMLAAAGYAILRIPNADVRSDPAGVVARIVAAASALPDAGASPSFRLPPERDMAKDGG